MKKILSIAFLVAGVQAAFAGCLGTVHVKLPDTWPSNFFVYSAQTYYYPKAPISYVNEYATFDLGDVITQGKTQSSGFAIQVNNTGIGKTIDANQYNYSSGSNPT